MPGHFALALATPLEPLAEPAWWIALGPIVAASLMAAGGWGRAGLEGRSSLPPIAVGVAIWLLLTPLVGVITEELFSH
jgi:hypothetical protein